MEAKPPLRLRKLRIAWSAVWGIAAVLLIVLWVRSYFSNDNVLLRLWRTHLIELDSQEGSFLTQLWIHPTPPPTVVFQAWSRNMQPSQFHWDDYPPGIVSRLGFHRKFLDGGWRIVIAAPHWSLALLTGTLASLSWLPFRKRFTLRTLLVATTLVGIALGLIVYMFKN
jgi:hypothetical protein